MKKTNNKRCTLSHHFIYEKSERPKQLPVWIFGCISYFLYSCASNSFSRKYNKLAALHVFSTQESASNSFNRKYNKLAGLYPSWLAINFSLSRKNSSFLWDPVHSWQKYCSLCSEKIWPKFFASGGKMTNKNHACMPPFCLIQIFYLLYYLLYYYIIFYILWQAMEVYFARCAHKL